MDRSTAPVDVGSRYITYATTTLLPIRRRKSSSSNENVPRSDGDTDEEEHGRLNARKVAGKVAKELVVGAKVIGGYAYQALSTYVAPQTSPTSSPSTPQNLHTAEHDSPPSTAPGDRSRADKKVDIPEGLVIVRDLPESILETSSPLTSATVICHWKPHTNPISFISFNPNQTLLVTASTQGGTFYVWQMPGRSRISIPKSARCLYKLERGYTSVNVEDVAFSLDSRWIAVSTAHGTTHIYRINPAGPKRGNASVERLNVINGLADAKGKTGSLGVDVPEDVGGRGVVSLWPQTRVKQHIPLERRQSAGTDGDNMGSFSAARRSSGMDLTGDGRMGDRNSMSSKSAVPPQPRAKLVSVFLRKKSTVHDFPGSPARSKGTDRRTNSRGTGTSPAGISPSSGSLASSMDQVSRVHRQQVLTFHPLGTLTLHNVDVAVENRPQPQPSASHRRSSVSSSPLDSLSPTGLLGQALKMTSTSGRTIKVTSNDVMEWTLVRESEWPEVKTGTQNYRSDSTHHAANHPTSSSASSLWPSKIEIVTYDVAAFGQPIWMGPQCVFQTFVHSGSASDSGSGSEDRLDARPSPLRPIRAGPWEDPAGLPIGTSAPAEADLSDLPEAVKISIKREAVKPYGDEGVPSRDIFPDVTDRDHHDVEEGISTAMDSHLDTRTSSPAVPIRDTTNKDYITDDLSFDDAYHISISITSSAPPPQTFVSPSYPNILRRTTSGISSAGSASSWPAIPSPGGANARAGEEDLLGLFDELEIGEDVAKGEEGAKVLGSPVSPGIVEDGQGDDEGMDSVMLDRNGEEEMF
ncbi:Breast carcinoma amplified sequence 3 [Rhizophlyctis rosea]|nr:Breast carcinoma amplified sequence 3 [Rhizophlyctis rosea]